VKRVQMNPAFRFTVKLWKRFTHERETAWAPAEADLVRSSLGPLASSGKLGTVLAQFPWSFKRSPENEAWLADLFQAFQEYALAIEVRHASWNEGDFYALLREHNVGIVNIDQPVFSHSIEPGARVTTDAVGYVRLHGRNYGNWFREAAETHERYDYL